MSRSTPESGKEVEFAKVTEEIKNETLRIIDGFTSLRPSYFSSENPKLKELTALREQFLKGELESPEQTTAPPPTASTSSAQSTASKPNTLKGYLVANDDNNRNSRGFLLALKAVYLAAYEHLDDSFKKDYEEKLKDTESTISSEKQQEMEKVFIEAVKNQKEKKSAPSTPPPQATATTTLNTNYFKIEYRKLYGDRKEVNTMMKGDLKLAKQLINLKSETEVKDILIKNKFNEKALDQIHFNVPTDLGEMAQLILYCRKNEVKYVKHSSLTE